MRWVIVFAGLSGAVMVGMGAYASHSTGGDEVRAWLQTGAQYGLWHSLALLGVAALGARESPSRWPSLSAVAFAAGIALFSGTLFIRALTDFDWVSKATPLGGICFIAGWLLLVVHGAVARRD